MSAVPISVQPIPTLNFNVAINAAAPSNNAPGSSDAQTGTSSCKGPYVTASVRRKIVCTANQTDRFKITPTTAAVTHESAAFKARCRRSDSMYGAPTKLNRKLGRNVTQVVTSAPKTAANHGSSGPAY